MILQDADADVALGGRLERFSPASGETSSITGLYHGARPERIDRDTRMPVVRRGNEDGVHLLHLQKPPVLGKVSRAGGCLAGLVDLLAVNVAYGHHIHGGNHLELGHVVPAALAAADYPQLDLVVGAEHAGIRSRRPANEVPSL